MGKGDNKDSLIFSLDIGTRTIIGLVCKKLENGKIELIESAVREHEQRTMYDGQIHDINGVVEKVQQVVKELEDKLNIKLNKVSIAAAGRALKTNRVFVSRKFDDAKEIEQLDISALEIEGIQKAEDKIKQESIDSEYFNIGYTPTQYYLDGFPMENLEGHKGKEIGVELLSTFLPVIVVESLYSVIEKTGLEIASITLEPIAAIEVAIEKDLRILNLALVDIGAGTSDIAITQSGKIISYSMIQKAGDEITEKLIQEYLLDFETAETIKKELNEEKEISITDILGNTKTVMSSEIIDVLDPTIEELAKDISENILKYNGEKPDAVFLIGGTSQIPRLKERIAEKLGISKDRISLQKLTRNKDIILKEEYKRSDMVTPIGIAYESTFNKFRNLLKVEFQGKEYEIFDAGDVKVLDLLVSVNYDPKNLFPKWGKDLEYYIDGSKRKILGKKGTDSKILINGLEANLQTIINPGDKVEVVESKIEEEQKVYLKDVVENVKEVLVNDREVDEFYEIKDGDRITFKDKDDKFINKIKDDLEEKNSLVLENKKEKIDEKMELIVNGKELVVEKKEGQFVFVDIFDFIDFDRTKVLGELCLKVNGEKADYFQEIRPGDEIEVYWKKQEEYNE